MRSFLHNLNQERIVFLLFLAIFVAFSVILPGFLNANNLVLLLQGISVLGILGVGLCVVVIGRGIDLSMVATMALSVAWALQLNIDGMNLYLALAIGLGGAVLVGLANGALIAYAEIPPLFATLASGACVYGFGRLALIHSDLVYVTPAVGDLTLLGQGRFLSIPMPVIVFAVIAVIVGLVLRYTKFGRFTYAVGDNYATARVSGVPVRHVILGQYVLTSTVAFVAGITQAMAVSSMNTRISDTLLIYEVILVVVLGGVGLSGGRGGVRNVIVGTLLIGTFLNGMTILDVQYTTQNAIKALILLIAIIADTLVNPRDEQTAQHGDI
ncbi:ABC transporter permease [Roseibium marinum]|uniref:Ribose transport system permease protein n=1 Tax=Roseibium marinum TaxID=281252 RepID=A0A2S3UN39_9HYPH|nr:ABC transporter permease [Roseibium marinum]POF29115.1 ribose transport system permease protein [Roseibium marinum]